MRYKHRKYEFLKATICYTIQNHTHIQNISVEWSMFYSNFIRLRSCKNKVVEQWNESSEKWNFNSLATVNHLNSMTKQGCKSKIMSNIRSKVVCFWFICNANQFQSVDIFLLGIWSKNSNGILSALSQFSFRLLESEFLVSK